MAAELLPGSITLKTVFYRYYEHRFGERYVWPFDLPPSETAEQHAEQVQKINSRDAQACQELMRAFLDRELTAVVYRPCGAGDGIAELDRDGWSDESSIGLFVGGPIREDEIWPTALGLTPTVSESAFEEWLDDKFGAEEASRPKGRRAQYDWQSFSVEAQRKLAEEGAINPAIDPNWNQAALEHHMADWCLRAWGKCPGESTIRMKLRPLLDQKGQE